MNVKCMLGLALALTVLGCQTVQTTSGGAVGVTRKQHMASFVSEKDIQGSAAQAYQEELQKAQKKNALNTDQAQVQRVRAIANRLIPQTSVFRPDAPNWKWDVNVQSSEQLNAYCMPGGKIMVYTGIIQKLSLTDDELAAVMGHEVAHALREHGRERVSQAYPQQALVMAAGIAGGEGAAQLAGMVAQVTFGLPYSRKHETEADLIGLELMARAGYNPQGAVAVWQKMQKVSQGQPAEFMSTHPSHETRIKDLQANIPKVQQLYDSAKKP